MGSPDVSSSRQLAVGPGADGVVREQDQGLGANYGAMVVFPFANASIEVPAVQLTNTVGTSFSDMLIRPLDLGWHASHSDVSAGLQLYMPTGRYKRGGDDNIGKGMWAYEPFAGATFYFD